MTMKGLVVLMCLIGLSLFQTARGGEAEKRFLKAARVKRDLTNGLYPGTKWCGKGNSASHKHDLGALANADACCRDHDSCPNYVAPFSVAHGIFNPSVVTWSRCDCDYSFYNCLKATGSEGSGVGIAYFNVIQNTCIYQGHPIKCDYFWGVPIRCYPDTSRWSWYSTPVGKHY